MKFKAFFASLLLAATLTPFSVPQPVQGQGLVEYALILVVASISSSYELAIYVAPKTPRVGRFSSLEGERPVQRGVPLVLQLTSSDKPSCVQEIRELVEFADTERAVVKLKLLEENSATLVINDGEPLPLKTRDCINDAKSVLVHAGVSVGPRSRPVTRKDLALLQVKNLYKMGGFVSSPEGVPLSATVDWVAVTASIL